MQHITLCHCVMLEQDSREHIGNRWGNSPALLGCQLGVQLPNAVTEYLYQGAHDLIERQQRRRKRSRDHMVQLGACGCREKIIAPIHTRNQTRRRPWQNSRMEYGRTTMFLARPRTRTPDLNPRISRRTTVNIGWYVCGEDDPCHSVTRLQNPGRGCTWAYRA